MKRHFPIIMLLGFFTVVTVPAAAEEHRLALLEQKGKRQNTGISLYFENSSQGRQPCTLDTLKLILVAGDGNGWKYIVYRGPWKCDTLYKAKVIATPKGISLQLNGKRVGAVKMRFKAKPGEFLANYYASGNHKKWEYQIVTQRLHLAATGKKPVTLRFLDETLSPQNIFASKIGTPKKTGTFNVGPKDTLTIESTFQILDPSSLAKYAPFLDKYGQWRHGDWPGKVTRDEQLKQRLAEERKILDQWGPMKGFDKYGGYCNAGWKEKPTGFFRVVKRDGFWWLISPEGNPCFYTGLCHLGMESELRWPITAITGREEYFEWLPPREGKFAKGWTRPTWGPEGAEAVIFRSVNLIRKYGDDWEQKSLEHSNRRFKAWGFSGGGKWCRTNPDPLRFSWMVTIRAKEIPKLVRHYPDLFDPEIKRQFEESLKRRIASYRDDPYIIGLSYGNEIEGLLYPESIQEVMNMEATVPAKRALMEYAVKEIYNGDVSKLVKAWKLDNVKTLNGLYAAKPKPPRDDLQKMRLFFTETFYKYLYQTFKKYDPNHLYCGFWIPGFRAIWGHTDDWFLVAKYCDVLGYDLYDHEFARKEFARLVAKANKPVLCGEFGFAVMYDNNRGFEPSSSASVKTEAQAGEEYQRWVTDATQNPNCIGLMYYCYSDQLATGRDVVISKDIHPGENISWGLVDTTDTPKWDLVKRVRKANLQATQDRLRAMNARAAKQP